MTHLASTLVLIALVGTVACEKRTDHSAELLHGTWVKGPNPGDTLRFFNRNGRSFLAYNLSFNPALYAPTEKEYRYADGKLSVKLFGATEPFQQIQSFTWKIANVEFEIQGIELFSFMSSTLTRFTYHRIP